MIKRLIVMLLLSVFLTGCYDNFDLEERSICTAMSIDYSEDEGYSIILSVPALEKEGEPLRELKTGTGKTIREAAEAVDRKSSKKLYFGHTRAVILGMGLLRNGQALEELTDYLKNNVQIDKNIILSAAYDPKAVMEADPGEDRLTGFYISDFYENGKDEKTFINKENLLDLLKEKAGQTAAAIPIISEENNAPAFSGIAILSGSKLKGVLAENAAYGFMWLSDRNFCGTLTSDIPFVSAEILEKKTTYEKNKENGSITVKIDAVGNMWNYTDDEIKSKAPEYMAAFKDKIKFQSEEALKSLCDMEAALPGAEDLKGENINVEVNLSLNFV